MKKLLALAIALIVMTVPVMAQQAVPIAAKARIHKMGTLGSGIAISGTNPMDFELLKIGVAAVKVGAEDTAAVRVGILYFGEDKYRLKDIVIVNGTATANIYYNGTQVGSISLDSYPKGDKEVWAGTLTLNGETYNAYVIQAKRLVKAVEKARRIFGYCEDHPAQCLRVMRGIGQVICDPEGEGTNCRERIRTYCENNPDDRRCVALRMAYCKQNLDDADCRAEFMERCKENVNEEVCDRLGEIYNQAIQKKPEFVSKLPDWFRRVSERIREGIQQQNNNTGNGGNGNGNGNGGE
ncbi:MAG: hypothetical protein JSV39_00385 [Candidatus Aenigmatarchaeota archaeon]|nr:MAG: hypothetical protein JSV39_00385 [Candidatus Aenigmarchaeota archaeon]